jgi:cytochrome d ubiquinol oxidase subunit I
MTAFGSPQLHGAFAVAIQLIFPGLAIGLAAYLAVLEGLWMATRADPFRALYQFWVRIFAVALAVGAVSALMIGARLHWQVGLAPALSAAAALAGLAWIMARDTGRLGAPHHAAATLLTALGAVAVSAWLVAIATRASTPAGGFDLRFAYGLFSAYLVTALGVGAASAWRLLRGLEEAESMLALRMALGTVAITAPLLFITVDLAPPAHAAHAQAITGWTLHAAAILGLALAAATLVAGGLGLQSDRPMRSRALLRACIGMGALGLAALLTGWIAAHLASTGLWGPHPGLQAGSPGLSLAATVLVAAGAALVLRLISSGAPAAPEDPAHALPHHPRRTA